MITCYNKASRKTKRWQHQQNNRRTNGGSGMKTYVVFLRGINAGGLKITMAELVKQLACPEFTAIETVLATGNVIIQTTLSAHTTQQYVVTQLSNYFGQPIAATLRTANEIAVLLAACPPVPAEYNAMLLLTEVKLYAELAPLFTSYDHTSEEVLRPAGPHAIYWLVKKGHTTQGFGGKVLGSAKYRGILTSRNVTTIAKIDQKIRTMNK